jgi:hypothetical protein
VLIFLQTITNFKHNTHLEDEIIAEISVDHLKLFGSGKGFGWGAQLDLGRHLFAHLQLAYQRVSALGILYVKLFHHPLTSHPPEPVLRIRIDFMRIWIQLFK